MSDILLCRSVQTMIDEMGQTTLIHTSMQQCGVLLLSLLAQLYFLLGT